MQLTLSDWHASQRLVHQNGVLNEPLVLWWLWGQSLLGLLHTLEITLSCATGLKGVLPARATNAAAESCRSQHCPRPAMAARPTGQLVKSFEPKK
eukprot:CAMPEP_0172723288 /NCGR_PEP_ID=MMETSP1074-20121228/83460_1 /TAXON_ID=2916 /ORGANISM="Ceratium fusus, Strain PA161109" /LENGTH=94 /DNA_ID=CAMNT_0013549501 /DNA_START=1087 /DNA_END=1368 /DNA_ORIENTATION=-